MNSENTILPSHMRGRRTRLGIWLHKSMGNLLDRGQEQLQNKVTARSVLLCGRLCRVEGRVWTEAVHPALQFWVRAVVAIMVWLAGAGHFWLFLLYVTPRSSPALPTAVGWEPCPSPHHSPLLSILPAHTHVSTQPLCSLSQPRQVISVRDTRVFCSSSLFHSS